MFERFTAGGLQETESLLGERDKRVLASVRRCRYLTTRQVQRLLFTDAVSGSAGLRAANRSLNKLRDLGLAAALMRRIGGVRAGSGSLIWHLTPPGEQLLRLRDSSAHPQARKRFFEPSPHFLAHTLSVAECFVQFTEICAGKGLELVSTELEPECWRSYSHKGSMMALRPDMYAETICGEYEDRWFIEIDLHTESPSKVVEKCRRYHDYYRSGLEQKLHGMFPLVVWIVPDAARQESIASHIREAFQKQPKIFIVITPDELETLVRQGVEGVALC